MIYGSVTIRIIGPDRDSWQEFSFDIREIPERPVLWQAIYDAGVECRDAIYTAAKLAPRLEDAG